MLAPVSAADGRSPPADLDATRSAALLGRDLDAYRDTCSRLLARVGGTDPRSFSPHYSINDAVFLLACGPQGVNITRDPSPCSRPRSTGSLPGPSNLRHVVLNTMGGLLYRSGDPAGAIRALRDGVGGDIEGKFVAQDWAFMALASHALGDIETARVALRRLEASPMPPLQFWPQAEILMLRREVNAVVSEIPRACPRMCLPRRAERNAKQSIDAWHGVTSKPSEKCDSAEASARGLLRPITVAMPADRPRKSHHADEHDHTTRRFGNDARRGDGDRDIPARAGITTRRLSTPAR